MTKHILCAIDLTQTESELGILRQAAALAEFYNATLSVVTVVPDFGMSLVGTFFQEGTLEAAIEAANEKLHEVVRDTLPDAKNVQHIVEVGTAYEKILAAIPLAKADLVVVGAHKPDLVDQLQGPNSARVARYAPCSVLVVRD